MKIQVDTNKLTDAPFNNTSTYPFSFDEAIVGEFADDIKFGNPTCYLISGYRGAGKSSFAKKVESRVSLNNNSVLFIHVNFTKYKSQNYLLRKLIRSLYQALTSEENNSILDNLTLKEFDLLPEMKTITLLERLYDQTFHDVTNSQTSIEEVSEEKRITLDFWLFFSFSLVLLLSLSNIIYPWITDNVIPTIVALITSAVGVAREAVSIKASWNKKRAFTKEFQRISLYDDEISDFHFNTILDKFDKNKIRLIFVLDELDKMKPDEVDPLINEMKPYLVSGKASFIVVAGQDLFYKYKAAQGEDDAVISTLFSRIIHVPLLSIDAFHALFLELISKNSNMVNLGFSEYKNFVDHLVFKSKRIPRRFVNLIRERISWSDERSIIIEQEDPRHKVSSKIINAIKTIDEKEVAIKLEGGARDYVIMQLFLRAERILSMGLDDCVFTKDDIIIEKEKVSEDKR